MRSPTLPLLLLAAVGLGAPAPAAPACRGPQQDPPAVHELLRTVRDRRLHVDDREPAVRALLARSPKARRALAEELTRQARRLAERWARDAGRLEARLARAARRVIRARLGRSEERELKELRRAALALSRGANLTKATITREIDPLVRRIEELVAVTVDEVLETDEHVSAGLDTALAVFDERAVVLAWLAEARAALAADPEGPRQLERLEPPANLAGADDALLARLNAAAALATPMGKADATTFARNAELASALDPLEVQGIRVLNLRRVHLGLAALRIDPKLCDAARDHSTDMVTLGFFSHESPVEGKRTVGQRAARFGTSASAENIAAGQSDGLGSFRAWWTSPGHHRNMLGGHGRVGLGRHDSHWTQLFGG